jgi:hypothetical protein
VAQVPTRSRLGEDLSGLLFAEQLEFHLKRGTHPKGTPDVLPEKGWQVSRFARLVGVSERTVRNWRNRRRPTKPSAEDVASVGQVFFGENQTYATWAEQLRTALHGPAGDAGPERRPCNLPFASLGSLFKGREAFMTKLREALAQDGHETIVIGKALHGLGGIGKTRLAIEYAWNHASEYSALLFVPADAPEKLNAGLAALAAPEIIDLPEKKARDDNVKILAALGWLERHPGWLMILDNVDDRKAMTAVVDLLLRLRGGHVLITGRFSAFPASIRRLELHELHIDDATSFLLERTGAGRRCADDDEIKARELAMEVGCLALGLEQAGAYIDVQRTGLVSYLKLWRDNRAKVADWFDKDLMSYDHDVGLAATWKTSVDRLTPAGCSLLEMLAFFDSSRCRRTCST